MLLREKAAVLMLSENLILNQSYCMCEGKELEQMRSQTYRKDITLWLTQERLWLSAN